MIGHRLAADFLLRSPLCRAYSMALRYGGDAAGSILELFLPRASTRLRHPNSHRFAFPASPAPPPVGGTPHTRRQSSACGGGGGRRRNPVMTPTQVFIFVIHGPENLFFPRVFAF